LELERLRAKEQPAAPGKKGEAPRVTLPAIRRGLEAIR
jgi:hypothetical protein